MSEACVVQSLKTDMYVIRETGNGQVNYRSSTVAEGRTTRHVTSEINRADMFRTQESAMDHLIFTLAPALDKNLDFTVMPVTMVQEITTNYHLGDETFHTRVPGRSLFDSGIITSATKPSIRGFPVDLCLTPGWKRSNSFRT